MENETLTDGINTGLLIQDPRATDYIAGDAVTGMPFENRNPSGDWQPYLPTAEMQIGVYFDTMACVTFSALNSIETQLNFMLRNNLIPHMANQQLTELGVLKDGQFNFSDRFTAKMSGTTRKGNYLVNVWDSIRHDGLLAESDWPYPRDQRQPVFDWDDYYKEIPQELKDKAKKILDIIDIRYEWLAAGTNATKEQIKAWLPMSPVQIATAVCPPWGGAGVVPACSLAVAHATMIRNVPDPAIGIFDHYVPYEKQVASDYKIPYALRGMVYMKNEAPSKPVMDPSFGKKLGGSILLAVEDHGSIWYVNKSDGKRIKIGRTPEEVSEFLQAVNDKKVDILGITNADLARISNV